ncbi:MAG: sodium/proton-translocating pyrophosphatase [Myxococcota bacterium]
MVFLALPFLLCVQILIGMMVSAIVSMRKQGDAEGRLEKAIEDDNSEANGSVVNEEEGDGDIEAGVGHQHISVGIDGKQTRKKLGSKRNVVAPFFRTLIKDQVIRSVLSIIGFIIILVVLVGPSSTFSKANSVLLPRYQFPSTIVNAAPRDKCRLVKSPNSGLPSNTFPRLELVSDVAYSPLDIYGERLPAAKNLVWSLLGCLILGLTCALIVGAISAYASSPTTRHISKLEADGFHGGLNLATGGSAIATVANVSVIAVTILSCYEIMRGYGVALASMGAMSALAPASGVSVAAHIARDTHRLLKTCMGSKNREGRSAVLAAGGGNESTMGWSKGVATSVMTLSAMSFVFIIILHTGVFASPTEIAGVSVTAAPTRHVADSSVGPSADLLDIEVLCGVLFGSSTPFIIACAAVAAAAVATSSAIAAAVRKEMLRRGWWSLDESSGSRSYEGCAQIALRGAGWGSFGPVSLSAILAFGGIWAGKGSWIGVVAGCVVGGTVCSMLVGLIGNGCMMRGCRNN